MVDLITTVFASANDTVKLKVKNTFLERHKTKLGQDTEVLKVKLKNIILIVILGRLF